MLETEEISPKRKEPAVLEYNVSVDNLLKEPRKYVVRVVQRTRQKCPFSEASHMLYMCMETQLTFWIFSYSVSFHKMFGIEIDGP